MRDAGEGRSVDDVRAGPPPPSLPTGADAVAAVLDGEVLTTWLTPAATDDEVLAGLATVEMAERAVDAARLALVAELEGRKLHHDDAGLNARSWLGHRLGWSSPRASRSVITARRLRTHLTVVADALAEGRISVEHAELLARLATPDVIDIVAALQKTLIGLADGVRFERWASDVANLIAAARPDGHEPRDGRSRASMSDGLDGSIHLDMDLADARAAQFRAAVLGEVDRRRAHHRRLRAADPDHEIPVRDSLVADAIFELVVRGHAAIDPHASRTSVTLVVHADEPSVGHTDDGVRLTDGATAVLACDADIVPIIVDSLGVPLDMGHAVRFFTPAQQRAIRLRDGGCVHPGCDAPARWTHIHHVEHWDLEHLTGPTDLANGAAGCGEHHRMWHDDGWWMRPDPERPGRFLITTPTGRVLRSQRHGRAESGGT